MRKGGAALADRPRRGEPSRKRGSRCPFHRNSKAFRGAAIARGLVALARVTKALSALERGVRHARYERENRRRSLGSFPHSARTKRPLSLSS